MPEIIAWPKSHEYAKLGMNVAEYLLGMSASSKNERETKEENERESTDARINCYG